MEAAIEAFRTKKDPSKLRRFILKANKNDLDEMIKCVICHFDFPEILSIILESFNKSDLTHCQLERHEVVEVILTALKTAKITNREAHVIVCRIILDFSQYSSIHLVKLVEFCKKSIRNNDDDFMSWKDIIPPLLEVLEDKEVVNNNGATVSGKEYKESVVKSLYSGQWDSKILPSLTTMFREISMTKEEHREIVRNLCNRLLSMPSNELPPLVHQLLALCRHHDSEIVIVALCKYFQQQYAEVIEDSEDLSEDIASDASSLKIIQEVESTIHYHIFRAVEVNQNCLKDFIKSLRNAINVPEYLLDPFIMTLLLNVSDIYEGETLELLKSATTRIIRENEKQKHSAWMQEVISSKFSILKTFIPLIEKSLKDRHMVVKALIDFAFLLMGTWLKFGDGAHNTTLRELGSKIIYALIKKRYDIGSTVMQNINDKIMCGGAAVSQYTNCLSHMCQKVPFVIVECQVWVTMLLEQLLIMNPTAATQVIFAIFPIILHRPDFRDTLSIVLRKALYSRETETRKMAVTGFLQLWKNFKINSLGALSQSGPHSSSNSSNFSTCTQVNIEVHVKRPDPDPQTNELMRFEVLGILKRCFVQPAEVKLCLYEGLCDVILMNSELSTYLVDMLLEHFKQYYETHADTLPPLKLDKLTSIRGEKSVLHEPIGHLILVMQRIYVKAADEETPEIKKLSFILESLCNRMAKSRMEHFQLEDGLDLFDNLLESQERLHNLKEMITVYEALISYRIVTWSKDSLNPAHEVYSLFEGYNRLLTRIKPAGKVKKGEGKKKKDKDPLDASFKKPSRTLPLKLPPTILDLDTVLKMMTLLYSDSVPWSDEEQTKKLRGKELFHRYILQTGIQLMQPTKQLKTDDPHKHKKQQLKTWFEIGSILNTKIISQLNDIRNFDQQTAIFGLECFKELCDLACTTFPSYLKDFLQHSGNVNPNADLESQLMSIIQPLKARLTEFLVEENDEESIVKKIPSILIDTLSLLILKLPHNGKSIKEILEWLYELATEKEIEQTTIIAVIQLILKIENYTTDYGNSINKIINQLCQIMGTVDDEEVDLSQGDRPFKISNKATAFQIHLVICNVLKQKLDDTSWFLGRLQAEHVLSMMSGMDVEERQETLKDKERKLTVQLFQIVQSLEMLSNVSIMPGPNADAVFKNLEFLYSTLSVYTKYFHNKSTFQNPAFQAVKFVSLIKQAGKPLAKTFYNLITHIEENQTTKSNSRKVDAFAQKRKVLKETKLIPKVIHKLEKFDKNILELSKKTKVPLGEYVNYSITRDFRIKNPLLIKGLETLQDSRLSTQDTNDTITSQANSSIDSDSSQPPSKKLKRTHQPKK